MVAEPDVTRLAVLIKKRRIEHHSVERKHLHICLYWGKTGILTGCDDGEKI